MMFENENTYCENEIAMHDPSSERNMDRRIAAACARGARHVDPAMSARRSGRAMHFAVEEGCPS